MIWRWLFVACSLVSLSRALSQEESSNKKNFHTDKITTSGEARSLPGSGGSFPLPNIDLGSLLALFPSLGQRSPADLLQGRVFNLMKTAPNSKPLSPKAEAVIATATTNLPTIITSLVSIAESLEDFTAFRQNLVTGGGDAGTQAILDALDALGVAVGGIQAPDTGGDTTGGGGGPLPDLGGLPVVPDILGDDASRRALRVTNDILRSLRLIRNQAAILRRKTY